MAGFRWAANPVFPALLGAVFFLLVVQVKTIQVLFRLNDKILKPTS